MLFISMAFYNHDVSEVIPPEEVPLWVKSDQVGVYLGVILASLVVYDAGAYHRHHSSASNLTSSKSVLLTKRCVESSFRERVVIHVLPCTADEILLGQ